MPDSEASEEPELVELLEAAELDPDHDADDTHDPEHEPDYEREAAEDAEIDEIDLDEEFPELVITSDDVRDSRLALEKVCARSASVLRLRPWLMS